MCVSSPWHLLLFPEISDPTLPRPSLTQRLLELPVISVWFPCCRIQGNSKLLNNKSYFWALSTKHHLSSEFCHFLPLPRSQFLNFLISSPYSSQLLIPTNIQESVLDPVFSSTFSIPDFRVLSHALPSRPHFPSLLVGLHSTEDLHSSIFFISHWLNFHFYKYYTL